MSEEELDIFDEKVKSDQENEEQPAEQIPGDIYDKEFDNIDELLKGVEDGDVTEKRIIKKRKISNEGVQEQKQQHKRANSKKEEEREQQRKKINEEVTQIKSLMDKYHKRDIKLVEDKLPALTKVKHIDEIIEKLSKREFIEQRGLDYLTNWLDKIPNGPEPSVSLRKKLLQFILELPIQRHHFQGIRLGKVIYKISSKSDVKELRNLATKVVEKWSKILNSRERNDDLDYQDDER